MSIPSTVKEGDTLEIIAQYDTGDLFGTLEAKKEHIVQAFTPDQDQSHGAPRFDERPIDIESEASVRAGVNRAQADMRAIATALEAHNIDYNKYPENLHSLTSPISYIRSLPSDPFAKDGEIYQYEPSDKKWKLWSIGPDQEDDKGEKEYSPRDGAWSEGDIIRGSRR
ncbi:MAG: type II secretion system protein GspG [Candidatus Sumerlaeota bacterium]